MEVLAGRKININLTINLLIKLNAYAHTMHANAFVKLHHQYYITFTKGLLYLLILRILIDALSMYIACRNRGITYNNYLLFKNYS